MKAVIISIPDGAEPQDIANFVMWVGTELANDMTSGHTSREMFWSIEEVPDEPSQEV